MANNHPRAHDKILSRASAACEEEDGRPFVQVLDENGTHQQETANQLLAHAMVMRAVQLMQKTTQPNRRARHCR